LPSLTTVVGTGEEPALDQHRLHRLEVLRRDQVVASLRLSRLVRWGLPLDLEISTRVVVAERHRVGEARVFDAGDLLGVAEQLLVEGAAARFVVSLLRDVDRGVQHVRRIEPEVDRLCVHRAADEEAGGDQQHE
jgi:hypothetical protein